MTINNNDVKRYGLLGVKGGLAIAVGTVTEKVCDKFGLKAAPVVGKIAGLATLVGLEIAEDAIAERIISNDDQYFDNFDDELDDDNFDDVTDITPEEMTCETDEDSEEAPTEDHIEEIKKSVESIQDTFEKFDKITILGKEFPNRDAVLEAFECKDKSSDVDKLIASGKSLEEALEVIIKATEDEVASTKKPTRPSNEK